MFSRLVAMHLARRLPARDLALGVSAGLQDTVPRAALLSLHARVEAVGPDTWEDPSLVQVWGPRMAAYLVPRDAFASFTLGRLPRAAEARSAIEALADRVAAALDGEPMRSNELVRRLDDLSNPSLIRAAAACGRFVIRWDARTTVVMPVDRPDVDVEDARVDLLRRYLAWFGPAGGAGTFARWAGLAPDEAAATWRKVPAPEPPPSDSAGGVRLLPSGDPYMYGRPVLKSPEREIPGLILLDGRAVGMWARRQADVTLRPGPGLGAAGVERIEEAAGELAGPLGRPVRVTVVEA